MSWKVETLPFRNKQKIFYLPVIDIVLHTIYIRYQIVRKRHEAFVHEPFQVDPVASSRVVARIGDHKGYALAENVMPL
jgi:hypothetical protein